MANQSSGFGLENQTEEIGLKSKQFVKDLFPIIGNSKDLFLDNVEIIKVNQGSFEDEMIAKESGITIGDKIVGSFVLKDKQGNILERKKKTIMTAPKVTARGSFIVKGNEYQSFNQLRLDAAVYTYRDGAGEVQSQFNLSKGTNFKLNVDPISKKFQMRIGSSKVDAFPFFKVMGVSDEDMKKSWGDDIFKANSKSDVKSLDKLHSKLYRGKPIPASFQVLEGNIKNYFDQSSMNSATNNITLGIKSDRVDANTLLSASKKYLDVAYGKKDEDEKDHMQFQTIHTSPDLIGYRMEHAKRPIKGRMQYKVDYASGIDGIVNKKLIDKPIESFFTQSELSSTNEQINPLHNYVNSYKVTKMGEGGIRSSQQITEQARNVHSSQIGFIDPYETAESSMVGVTTALAMGARKGEGNRITTQVFNMRSKKMENLTPKQFAKYVVAFPDQFDKKMKPINSKIEATKNGKPIKVSLSDVDYVIPTENHLFSLGTSMIPFGESNQGNRKMMAAKQIPQHTMLKYREAPLVQVQKGRDGSTISEALGQMSSIVARSDGKVIEDGRDKIVVKTAKGNETYAKYNNFFLNQKSFLDHESRVKVGEFVKKGDLLADGNTTKDGVWAPGVNLNVAYMPYKGLNFEDGIVLSQSAAKKMTSYHMHKAEVEKGDGIVHTKKKFIAHFPTAFTRDQLEKIDDKGMAIIGTKLNYGDPILLTLKKRDMRDGDLSLGMISKKLDNPYSDKTETWKYKFKGEVVRTYDGKNKVVRVRSEEPIVQADKLAGRHGNKGVITTILPDYEMPTNKAGVNVDIILNPQGVIGRINPSQLLENAAGKIAKKTGRVFKVKNYKTKYRNDEFILNELKKNGLSEKEELFDPLTGKSFGQINTGYQMMLKLDHSVRKKSASRGVGGAYTSENSPGKGAQAIGSMEVNVLLAHGAKENLREMGGIKSDRNDDFWNSFQSGQAYTLPKKMPFSTSKLLNNMKTLGVDHTIQGQNLTFRPMTSEKIEELSSGEVTNGRLLRSKNLSTMAEKGGLFDPTIFGGKGVDGKKWGHVNLTKKIPNPIFEDAIKGVTGLTGPQFDGLMQGSMYLDSKGNIVKNEKTAFEKTSYEGVTGPEAIAKLLLEINPTKELEKLKSDVTNTKSKTKRNQIFKKMKYLRGLNRLEVGTDAYMIDKVAVLPPELRPIIPMSGGDMLISDANHGYKDLIGVNNSLKDDMQIGLGDESKLTYDLYRSTKALQGLGDPISYGKEFKGTLDVIKGTRNKNGYFQGKMVKRRQEISGRSTITPNPKLGIDQVGIPENMAWDIFSPMIKRKMSMSYDSKDTQKLIDDKSPVAKRYMESAMSEGHVFLNRAPSLHKGSIMAFKPQLAAGDAIEIPNLVVGPFGADFDGDCVLANLLIRRCLNSEISKIHISDFPHDGVISKKNEKVTEYEVDSKYEIFSFEKETLSWRWMPITKFSIHYDLVNYIVKYKSGRELECSDDASLFIVPKGELYPRRMKPVDSIDTLSPNPKNLKLDILTDKIELTQYNDGGLRRGGAIDSLDLNRKSGWFCGMMVGDGWINIENKVESTWPKVMLTNQHEGVVNEYIDYVESILPEQAMCKISSQHDFDGHDSYSEKRTFSCEDLAWFIYKETGKGAYNKHLPSFTLETSEEYRWGLLSGLMDSDGHFGWSNSKGKKPQFNCRYDTKSELLMEDFTMLCWSLGIKTSVTKSRGGFIMLLRTEDVKRNIDNFSIFQKSKNDALERLRETELRFDQTDYLPVTKNICDEFAKLFIDRSKVSKNKNDMTKYSAWKASSKKGRSIRENVKIGFEQFPEILDICPESKDLKKILDSGISYDIVKSIELQGDRKTMYDLTIPGSFTFLTANGISVFDTMSVHVPVSKKANQEAERMLPSSMLFDPGNKSLFFAPSQGAVLGLYNMSKDGGRDTKKSFSTIKEAVKSKSDKDNWNDLVTVNGIKAALGSHMINDILPKDVRDYKLTFGSEGIKSKLTEVAQKHKSKFGEIVNHMKNLGYEGASGEGNTISVGDFSGFSKERDTVLKAYDIAKSSIGRITNKSDRDRKMSELQGSVVSTLESKQKDYLKKRKGNVFNMLDSGSRGNAGQVRQVIATPFMVQDINGNALDMEMRRGYIEGQSLMESVYSAQSARSGAVKKSDGVTEPGMYAKMLTAVNVNTIVTEIDCKTMNGTWYQPEKAVDRYLSESSQGVGKRNDLVTPSVVSLAKKKKVKLKIRTQMTCEAKKGVCSMCYGISEDGDIVSKGDHVGVKDAQSLSQPLTNLSFKSFHTGGLAESKVKRAQGFDRMKQLYSVPENLPGHAIMSSETGIVDRVEDSPAGGKDFYINGVKQYSPSPEASVKKGDMIRTGARLSEGYFRPQDVLKYHGKEKAQAYMIDQMDKTMQSTGFKIGTRTYETIVNNQTALARVTASDHPDFLVGDVTKSNNLDRGIRDGYKVEYDNLIRGIERVPGDDTVDTNLFQAMNYRELQKNVKNNLSFGHDIKFQDTTSPIASYVMGNFGKDGDGNSTTLF